jgi:hypothetical protein
MRHIIEEHYATLELPPFTPIEDVKRAYKDLVTVWHPDRFQNNQELKCKAEEKLKRINIAYEAIRQYLATDHGDQNAHPKRKTTVSSVPFKEMEVCVIDKFIYTTDVCYECDVVTPFDRNTVEIDMLWHELKDNGWTTWDKIARARGSKLTKCDQIVYKGSRIRTKSHLTTGDCVYNVNATNSVKSLIMPIIRRMLRLYLTSGPPLLKNAAEQLLLLAGWNRSMSFTSVTYITVEHKVAEGVSDHFLKRVFYPPKLGFVSDVYRQLATRNKNTLDYQMWLMSGDVLYAAPVDEWNSKTGSKTTY